MVTFTSGLCLAEKIVSTNQKSEKEFCNLPFENRVKIVLFYKPKYSSSAAFLANFQPQTNGYGNDKKLTQLPTLKCQETFLFPKNIM